MNTTPPEADWAKEVAQAHQLALAAQQKLVEIDAHLDRMRRIIQDTQVIISRCDQRLKQARIARRSVSELVQELFGLMHQLQQSEAAQLDDLAATRAQVAETRELLAKCGVGEMPFPERVYGPQVRNL
jgi:hypothetical protein